MIQPKKAFWIIQVDGRPWRVHLIKVRRSSNSPFLPETFLDISVSWISWTTHRAMDPWKVPNIKTKNKSNLANDDYSGFVENSNSIRFFPSVEERNFSKVKARLAELIHFWTGLIHLSGSVLLYNSRLAHRLGRSRPVNSFRITLINSDQLIWPAGT